MTGGGTDPVEAGLIESLARPGGNVTGLTNLARDLGGKRLELLKEAVPKVARVAILYDPANPAQCNRDERGPPSCGARAEVDCFSLGRSRASDGFDKVFAAMTKQRPDGLYALGGPLMIANRKRIVDFALKNRLPSTDGGRAAGRGRRAHVLRGGPR